MSQQQCTERHSSSHIYDGDKISHRLCTYLQLRIESVSVSGCNSKLLIMACAKINCITAKEVKRETQGTTESTTTTSGIIA